MRIIFITFLVLFSCLSLNADEKQTVLDAEKDAFNILYKKIIHKSFEIKKKNREISSINKQISNIKKDIMLKEAMNNHLLKQIQKVPSFELLMLNHKSSLLQAEQKKNELLIRSKEWVNRDIDAVLHKNKGSK